MTLACLWAPQKKPILSTKSYCVIGLLYRLTKLELCPMYSHWTRYHCCNLEMFYFVHFS
jgi:hypothetical protein